MRLIRSAGGVVWRDGADGVEIAVVHRGRYDDWSLPKGKLDRGEHVLAAAVREVREETGIVAVPQVRLPSVQYLTGEPDTEKTVDFWSMRALTVADFRANDEVGELRWMRPAEADGLLTYAHDRGVVTAFAGLRRVTGIAVVVRHATAGKRSAFDGPDDQRPLDDNGKAQAARLGPLLAVFKPARVYAAPIVRCVDSVAQIGLPVRQDTVFAEVTAARPAAVADRIRALVAEHGRVVVSSQGGVIPAALVALQPPNTAATQTFVTAKGDAWVLSFDEQGVVAADHLPLDG
jgi:8-oxo-dGTP pyrophosphatase MutT (NUDIX family)/broad specificity phosphatase PhoE